MSARLSGADRELLAATITDPELQLGYRQARRLNAEHGKTYYLATLLLPRHKRPYVHALYGFARYADDVVDDLDPGVDDAERERRFTLWSNTFLDDLASGESDDPICRAVLDTQRRWNIPAEHFTDFLNSMRMDLTVRSYADYAELCHYMWGSAAVIGLQMLPILGLAGPGTDEAQVRSHAVDLGLAFQLTNFIRDTGEDLDRGRVYLPQDSLRAFGVDTDRLLHARRTGTIDTGIRDLIAYEVDRAAGLYASARPGIAEVDPTSRDCLRTALVLYGGILDEIRAQDYNVFTRRATVSRADRIRVGGAGLARAYVARLRS